MNEEKKPAALDENDLEAVSGEWNMLSRNFTTNRWTRTIPRTR